MSFRPSLGCPEERSLTFTFTLDEDIATNEAKK